MKDIDYEIVVGLEIHAELLTKSKVFCSCSAEFGGEENTRVCPKCGGFPGTLPSFNSGANLLAIKAGLATGCHINNFSAFDRKNYFYPDLPKAYQITQFNFPICTNGFIDIGDKTVRINRIHIEEDAGKLTHSEEDNLSLADYNRCGVPLIEIVTEPDISSADEAKRFVEQIALRLKYAGVCDGKMEQGSLRCDVNISIKPRDSKVLGTRTEIKNLNSFRSIVRAIEYEAKRQREVLESGGEVLQETLHYDDATGTTRTLRTKAEAHDYRYFPEPDIPPIFITDEEIESLRAEMPEMPGDRENRYVSLGLSAADAYLLISDKALSDFYDAAVKLYNNPKSVATMVIVELLRRLNDLSLSVEDLKITPRDFAELCKMADEGIVNRSAAKDILKEMIETGGEPKNIAEKNGMIMSNNTEEVEAAVDEILALNPKAVGEYKSGSLKVFGFLMGQACKKLGKSSNPAIVKAVLTEKLK